MKLIVLKNNVKIHEIKLESTSGGDEYFIGRSDDCHLVLDDLSISRHHLVLKNNGKEWIAEKMTRNGGISLNSQDLQSQILRDGDVLKFSCYLISISIVDHYRSIPENEAENVEINDQDLSDPVKDFERSPQMEVGQTEIDADLQLDEPHYQNSEDLLSTEDSELALSEENLSNDINDNFFDQETPQEVSEEIPEPSEYENFANETEDVSGTNDFSLTSESDSHESTQVFKNFVNYQLLLFGDFAPYDRFELDQSEIYIGRDTQKCHIVLNDPEVSSVHAVIKKNFIEVTLEDLNSSNGTILNGERVNKATLSPGDEFLIGGTSFTLQIKSDLLQAESDTLMPVSDIQEVDVEEFVEEELAEEGSLNFTEENNQEKSVLKRIWRNPEKRKKAIYLLAGIVLIWVMFSSDEENNVVEKDKKTSPPITQADPKAPTLKLSKENESKRNVAYELGVSYFDQQKYFEAEGQFRIVSELDSNYKNIQSYLEQTKIALKKMEEIESKRRAEEDRIKTKKIIDDLLVKAKEAVDERSVTLAENLFAQITEKDPENLEVSQLKLELESWQKEEEKKAMEKAAKDAARRKMVDSLSPGKNFYIKKEWYKSVLKLEEFLRIKNMDEDLIKEASDMLSDAKEQLSSQVNPLIGKARSLKEGQDLRSAYETFIEILKIDPTNFEALNEIDDIKTQLDSKSKKIYREAIIAESLSLFSDAKEKFQEVQQISPTDSDYYKKATEKLKNYLE